MTTLFRHIEFLLLRHDCVIVPGFGAFIATSCAARIDFDKGKIIPPRRIVMFNQAVATEDGLLANSYSRKYGLSFEESCQIISRSVALLKHDLAESGKVDMGKIGSFIYGEEGNVIFVPRNDSEKTLTSLGFYNVSYRINVNDVSNNENKPQSSIENDSKLTNGSRYYNFKINKTLIRIVAIVLAVLSVSLTMILHPTSVDNLEQRASVIPVEAFRHQHSEKAYKPDSSIVAVAKPQSIAEDTEAILIPPSHYLIVATFKTTAEAQKYVDRYSTVDFPLEIVISKKVTRVAAGSSEDINELRVQQKSSSFKSKFSNAWIWSRN